MLVDERRKNILQLIEGQGFASLAEVAERVGASESTIRRDLEYLDSIGQVRRTRGGAAYVGESLTAFEERRSRSLAQKQAIARSVAAMIQPGEAILLDGGTTTLEVARQLIGKSLQVVTNSLPIVNLLVNQPDIELILIGGYLYPKTGVALGPMAKAAVASLRLRRLVMSVGGITEEGLFNSNALLVETEQTMLRAVEEVLVVADSSKFGHAALGKICPLSDVHKMVVDDGVPAEWKAKVEQAGVEVVVARR